MTSQIRRLALGLGVVTALFGVGAQAALRARGCAERAPRADAPLTDSGEAAPPPPPIRAEDTRRINPGMLVTEVERLLGPARDETAGRVQPFYPPTVALVLTTDGPLYSDKHWIGNEAVLTLRINNRTKIVEQVWSSVP